VQGALQDKKGKYMKTAKKEEMRDEYTRKDLGKGIRGKYYEEYKKGTNLVLLSPDVAAAFPDDISVNNALRSLIKIAQQSTGLKKRSTGSRLSTR
jgi:hypothetical protein